MWATESQYKKWCLPIYQTECQRARMGNQLSSRRTIEVGVPQVLASSLNFPMILTINYLPITQFFCQKNDQKFILSRTRERRCRFSEKQFHGYNLYKEQLNLFLLEVITAVKLLFLLSKNNEILMKILCKVSFYWEPCEIYGACS